MTIIVIASEAKQSRLGLKMPRRAIVLRHDREFERLNTKLDDMLQQRRVMVAQQQRTAERVRQLEEQC
jgi:hypothetical protein